MATEVTVLDTELQEALNEQVGREFYSAYLYLAMSAAMAAESLDGLAHWLQLQAQEEIVHALKIYEHILDRGGRVELRMIEAPGTEFGSPLEVFRAALEHERHITRSIDKLYELANQKKDRAAQALLQWFVTEQVEEEKSAETIVSRLERGGGTGAAVLIIDRELGARTSAGA